MNYQDPSFTGHNMETGVIYDYSKNQFPTILHGFDNMPTSDSYVLSDVKSTKYIYAMEGTNIEIIIRGAVCHYYLRAGQYACVPGWVAVRGKGIIMERLDYFGVFSLGGPIEESGRLNYIDGCTDSLLIPPIRIGDPCLNALFFPSNIDQTEHTHPSMRVGCVASGYGECVTPCGVIPLSPGMIFIIHEDGLHKFRTIGSAGMVVIAYHPDSDFGPTDEVHPMINRTIVDGVSASQLPDIQTKS